MFTRSRCRDVLVGQFGADGVAVQDDHLTVERHDLRLHVRWMEPVEVVVNDVGEYDRNALGIRRIVERCDMAR